MEFSCSADAFKRAFNTASRAVPTRSPKPVLQSVKVTADPDGSTIEATSLELSIRSPLLGATVSVPGACLMPQSMLDTILSSLAKDAEIRFSLDGSKLAIRSGSARWTLQTGEVAEFPSVPAFAPVAYHTLTAGDFRMLAKRTMHAADVNSTRYALGGCCVDGSPTSVSFVATDGRAMAMQTVDADYHGEWSARDDRPVIPIAALNLLTAILSDESGPVDLGFPDQNTVHVRCDGIEFVSRLCEGRFPGMPRFPKSKHESSVPVGEVRAAVQQASACVSIESQRLTLAFSADGLRITGTAADVGDSEVSIPFPWPGKPLEIDLSHVYLSAMLRAVPAETVATFGLRSSDDPIVMTTADGFMGSVAVLAREKQ